MKVEKLTLRNFRNIEQSSLHPHAHLNFLVGINGQGKTSFIEALSFLSTLRSFRGAKNDEVIRWDTEWSEISCILSEGDWKTEIKVTFSKQGNRSSKVAFINGKAYKSSTQFLSQRFGSFELGFHTVVFNPSDHDLVRGEPSIRRSYMDRVISAEDLDYLTTLTKYQRLVDQRNALLKNEVRVSKELLAGFSEPLVSYGAQITYKRLQWIQRLKEHLNPVAHQIAPRQPDLAAFYTSNWVPNFTDLSICNNKLGTSDLAGQSSQPSLEILEQSFWKQLSVLGDAELRSRSTLVGPHRDDWVLYLGPQVLKGHGSQGEVRSALLALKLSEIELFRKRTGHRPLLLLDDFSSELDRERRSFLLRYLSETDLQVFVTSTEEPPFEGKRFWVSGGTLTESTASLP
ncbi:MAG: DNA replication/repair protein RecF [Methylotenera sp.]|nr:DNA replication/repair protein RecF [Oligoflexia bacterium]